MSLLCLPCSLLIPTHLLPSSCHSPFHLPSFMRFCWEGWMALCLVLLVLLWCWFGVVGKKWLFFYWTWTKSFGELFVEQNQKMRLFLGNKKLWMRGFGEEGESTRETHMTHKFSTLLQVFIRCSHTWDRARMWCEIVQKEKTREDKRREEKRREEKRREEKKRKERREVERRQGRKLSFFRVRV